MQVALVTGAGGLVGAESVRFFTAKGLRVVGVDNDMRSRLFGHEASTSWNCRALQEMLPGYRHVSNDIRDSVAMQAVFSEYNRDISLVVHAAAQPSHDWAARDPVADFSINADGTLTLLQCCHNHCPDAVFIYLSTNKVYGDHPNQLPLIEQETRWELDPGHPYYLFGIDENMSIDQSTHSLMGVSKLAADLLVQEYGRYFGMRTVCFRGGCLTGPDHSATMLHGFLAYLVRCALTGRTYTVFGYKGKQVRDNIHVADLVAMFWHFFQEPRCGAVYNVGGGRFSHTSLLEAVALCDELTGRKLKIEYNAQNRRGDHRWYVSDTRKFQSHYPAWKPTRDVRRILGDLIDGIGGRVTASAAVGDLPPPERW